MSHFEFKPSKKKGRSRYVGLWSQSIPKAIDLSYTVNSLITVLTWGLNPQESKFTHQDICYWCDRFHMAMFDVDTDNAMDVAAGVACDVDAQWGMYLANTYKLEELQKLDFSQVQIPIDWFNDWLVQIKNA